MTHPQPLHPAEPEAAGYLWLVQAFRLKVPALQEEVRVGGSRRLETLQEGTRQRCFPSRLRKPLTLEQRSELPERLGGRGDALASSVCIDGQEPACFELLARTPPHERLPFS